MDSRVKHGNDGGGGNEPPHPSPLPRGEGTGWIPVSSTGMTVGAGMTGWGF